MEICSVKEIFESIQGEGIYIGEKQIFVRFEGCNLSCRYCDTEHMGSPTDKKFIEDELYNEVKQYSAETISFTGGEPLLHTKFLLPFLENYKNLLNKKIYLETNGTLFGEMEEIKNFVDVVAMDIKIKSATGEENRFDLNDEFLKAAIGCETFVKVVFDKNILDDEIIAISKLASKYQVKVVLQPKMPLDNCPNLMDVFNRFFENYKNIRLIPQTHKFLDIR